MPTLSITKAPTYSLSIQLYARIGGAVVGGVRALTEIGTGGLYQCEVPTGDYDGQLLGFTDPVGPRFPIRNGIGYEGIPWSVIDGTVFVPPVIPSPITGLCNVLCSVTLNGLSVAKATFQATLEDENNTVNNFLASRAIDQAITDNAGNCILTLIQFAQFTRGGVYRIIGKDPKGRVFLNRRVIIPNTPTANAEDLQDEPEQIV